jgi:hypothetical protein
MAELKILIFPYFEELKTPVKENVCDRVICWVEKYKTSWENNTIEEPEIGYLGMMLECDDGKSIYVNDDLIVYSHDNITQWLSDPKKRINDILLDVAIKKYYDELNYFFEVKRYSELNKKKKRRRKKRIEDALRMFEE